MKKYIIFILSGIFLITLGICYSYNKLNMNSIDELDNTIKKIKHIEIRITPGNSVVLNKTEVNEFKSLLTDYHNNGRGKLDYPEHSVATLIFVINKSSKYRISYYDRLEQVYFVNDRVGDKGILMNVDEKFISLIEEIIQ